MSGRKGGGGRSGRGRSSKYQEDLQPSDDEEDLVHTFDVSEKLKSKDFPRFFVSEITGEEVSKLVFGRTFLFLSCRERNCHILRILLSNFLDKRKCVMKWIFFL
jgi:hypothetical protein